MAYKRKGPRYVLTEGDAQIFMKAATDARYFTEFYFGGITLYPFQMAIHHASQPELTVIGGYGSGKTSAVAQSACIHSTMSNGFKFMNVSDVAWQASQMYIWIVEHLQETPWWQRFVRNCVERPYPKITIEYEIPASITGGKPEVVRSTMEFMSIADQGKHILSWEGDWINIDEAGIIPDLEVIGTQLGSRLRGAFKGRRRMGRFSMTSNSWDNIDMWYRYDLQELDPATYLSLQVKTSDNKSLDDRQLSDMRRRVLDGDYDRWLDGGRPAPTGNEFSFRAIESCRQVWLDSVMDNLRKSDGIRVCPRCHANNRDLRCGNCSCDLSDVMPFHGDIYYQEVPKAGIAEWALPPDQGRIYLLVGDPGQGNAPTRNAPVIMVWDVTEFERKDGSAVLRAFWWGNGNGKYEPFIQKFLHYKHRYGCMESTFDSTGTQQSFDTMFTILEEEFVTGTVMSGPSKNHALVTLKLLLERQKLSWAAQIKGIGQQLGNYVLPDTKIPQDIVATMMIMALWLRRYYYAGVPGGPTEDYPDSDRPIDRFAHATSGRFRERNR